MSNTGADPFAYLEDSKDPATLAWTENQNARTREMLDAIPVRAGLARRFEELLAIDSLGAPIVRAERAFFLARRGTAEQTVLFVRENGRDRPLLDPAILDPTGLTAVDWWYPSPRGTFVAFGLSHNGSERSTLHVLDVASGERLSEAIADTRFASVAWFPDEAGFFYTRYPPGGSYDVRAYRHVLGSPPETDVRIFGDGRKPEETIVLENSSDGRWLVATANLGWVRSDVYVADTTAEPLRFVPLSEGVDARFEVRPTNRALFVRTDEGASRFRVYEVAPLALEREHWREIVPEGAAVLAGITATRNALALHYLEDVRSAVRFRFSDGSTRIWDGLAAATLFGWSSSEDQETLYALCASYLEAPIVRAVHIAGGEALTSVWEAVASPIDPANYRVEQHWYVSKDGTRIPMDVLSRADTPRDGSAPAVLYGYGGFNISLLPAFAPTLVPWLEAGGVYAVANLRGGGEFGEDWHRAGMRERKQNVFDDFIAAAEYLSSSGIADARRLAIFGGSNGGLLVAVVATQRPDLARAVVCVVPLTDMLRFHLFLIARLWIAEYGDPDDPRDAQVLRAYSPYHNVRDGVAYPAMLIETAESDGRVDPMHARKFAARLQSAKSGVAPVLLYVELKAGHGAGKPRYKQVAELADRWSFIFRQLGAHE
jgi:prolyl oligopeptidase